MEWRGIGQHSSGATIPRQALMARRACGGRRRRRLTPLVAFTPDLFIRLWSQPADLPEGAKQTFVAPHPCCVGQAEGMRLVQREHGA
jgi:hypothetical protein